jgi:hypothetical protein
VIASVKRFTVEGRVLTDARDEYLVGRSFWGVLESFASRMCTGVD